MWFIWRMGGESHGPPGEEGDEQPAGGLTHILTIGRWGLYTQPGLVPSRVQKDPAYELNCLITDP